jgi:chitinase
MMYALKTFACAGLLASAVLALPAPSLKARSGNPRLSVYWGAEDDSTTLDDVCSDSSYGIVNLAFISYFFSAGGYPALSLSSLGGPSQAQKDAGATSLQDGSSLVSAIQSCQNSGKLVIMSMGGAQGFADVTLANDTQAEQIADTLWNLFGGGTNDSALRPFGTGVKLDGFDLGKCAKRSVL